MGEKKKRREGKKRKEESKVKGERKVKAGVRREGMGKRKGRGKGRRGKGASADVRRFTALPMLDLSGRLSKRKYSVERG